MIPFHKGIIILTGNIGTGKSTFSSSYKSKYWQESVHVYEMDRYVPKIQKFTKKQQKEVMSNDLKPRIELNDCVIIDGVNLSAQVRQFLFECIEGFDGDIISIDFGPGSENTLENRMQENRGVDKKEWEKEHSEKQMEYEKPSKAEGFNRLFKKVGENKYIEIDS